MDLLSRPIASACTGALMSFWMAGSDAQTMYKCVDGQKRVTYSNIACEKQGLKDAGPVADRTTTMPFGPAQKAAPRTAPAAPAPGPGAQETTKGGGEGGAAGSQVKPTSPPIEKPAK
jgi:hypothetical protein